jgi:hypothetical protein
MSWLSSKTLNEKVRKNADSKTLEAFYGVCSIDNLPDFIHVRPFIMIINTHTQNLPGEHWITVMIDANRNGELFDSLGLPPSNIIIRWLNQFTNKWKKNERSFQHRLSSTCGTFALYFVLNRLRVKDFETLTNTFTTSSYANEFHMKRFYRSLK